jgi:hypothetical protein
MKYVIKGSLFGMDKIMNIEVRKEKKKKIAVNKQNTKMRTFYEHKHNCPSLLQTSSSYNTHDDRFYVARPHDMTMEQNNYLSSVNFRLLVIFSNSSELNNRLRDRKELLQAQGDRAVSYASWGARTGI